MTRNFDYSQLPNVLGFIFGVAQMILYLIYKKQEIAMAKEMKLPEHTTEIIMISAAAAATAADKEKEDSSLPPSVGAIEVIITNGIEHDNKMELDLKVKDKDKNLEVNDQITVPIVV